MSTALMVFALSFYLASGIVSVLSLSRPGSMLSGLVSFAWLVGSIVAALYLGHQLIARLYL